MMYVVDASTYTFIAGLTFAYSRTCNLGPIPAEDVGQVPTLRGKEMLLSLIVLPRARVGSPEKKI